MIRNSFSGSKTLISKDELGQTFLRIQNPEPKKKREKVNRVCIKARVQHLLKFRATVSCLYPTAEGMATIYIPTLGPMVCLGYSELANSGQLERSRDETPRPGPAGNSACALQWGKKRRVWSSFWCRAGGFRWLSCLLLLTAVRYRLL